MTSLIERLRRLFGFAGTKSDGEVRWVNVADLQMGPIRPIALTPEQVARIERLHERLNPLDGWSLEKRTDLFQRDAHLDRELGIMESVADVCDAAFGRLGVLSYEQRREVYGLATVASGSPHDVLDHYTPRTLSIDQAKVVVSLFK